MSDKIKKTVSVCAWCPDKEQKELLAKKRWQLVSHGICAKCSKKHGWD